MSVAYYDSLDHINNIFQFNKLITLDIRSDYINIYLRKNMFQFLLFLRSIFTKNKNYELCSRKVDKE